MCQEYSEDCTKASVEYAVEVIFQTAIYVLPSKTEYAAFDLIMLGLKFLFT